MQSHMMLFKTELEEACAEGRRRAEARKGATLRRALSEHALQPRVIAISTAAVALIAHLAAFGPLAG